MDELLTQATNHVPLAAVAAIAALAIVLAVVWYTDIERPDKAFPVVSFEEDGLSPKQSWIQRGLQLQAKGLRKYEGRPFQVITGSGPKVILANCYAEEFRKLDDANCLTSIFKDFMSGWPGFDGVTWAVDHERIFVDTVRVDLTRSLGMITNDLVDEAKTVVPDILGESPEWQAMPLKRKAGQLIASLSSRVFLGEELCRNETWLDIARNYTVELALASMTLRATSSLFRPITYWWNPHAAKLRKYAADARRIIGSEVKRRTERARKALEAGQKPPKFADTIGWMVAHAHGREDMDYAAGQLGLTFAAIHTTTEALSAALVDICSNADVVKPLRDEIIGVLKEHGWSRDALFKMRLMDSFLKESQRLHPIGGTLINRIMTRDVTLSDGTVLRKGTRTFVIPNFDNPAIYPEPEKFDAYRFLKLRDASKSSGPTSTWQHTTVSTEHLGWGFGDHACPGRFFASNELKIALAFLLLRYDWKLEEGPTFATYGTANVVSPQCQVSCRRRQAEVEL